MNDLELFRMIPIGAKMAVISFLDHCKIRKGKLVGRIRLNDNRRDIKIEAPTKSIVIAGKYFKVYGFIGSGFAIVVNIHMYGVNQVIEYQYFNDLKNGIANISEIYESADNVVYEKIR